MKVLLVTDEMELGGTQRQITELALGLHRRGDRVTVCWFVNPSWLVGRLREAGVEVVQVPKAARLDPVFVLRLARLLAGRPYDVVHAFSFTAELWTALARLLVPGAARVPLVSSVRGVYSWYTPLQWRLKRWVTRRSAAVVANAAAPADHAFDRMGLPADRLRIVRNGLTAPAARDALRARHRTALGVPEDTPVALFVGRLVEHKNLPMLLRAAARRAQAGSRLRWWIVGDGPLFASLRTAVVQAGLHERIMLLGARDDATELMAAADLLVLPSWREGLPNVVLEAMQAGCPVVATRVGGIPEAVDDGATGLLVPRDDDAALAAALARLEGDPALRARLAAAAAERCAREHGAEQMVTAMRAVYASVLAPRAAPGLEPDDRR